MQSFDTADTRFEFEVDGRKLWLPGMTPEVVTEVGELSKIKEVTEQFAAYRGVMEKHVGPSLTFWQRLTFQKSPARILHDAPFRTLGLIGKGWSGLNLGNSSSSSD